MARSRAVGVTIGAVGAAGFICCVASEALGGPCTAQIAAFEQQMRQPPTNPNTGPTFPQTLGAQLHRQPTPQDVQHAETEAVDTVDAELAEARKADKAGNAQECNAALNRARNLDGVGK